LEAVCGAYLALEAEAAKVRLINEQKTKYMIAAGNRMILNAARQTVKSCLKHKECEAVFYLAFFQMFQLKVLREY
jgi:hypothetical protein